jgi:IS1 family transposase
MANILSTEKKVLAVKMLCEGNSIRAIERMTGIHRNTIMRLGVRVCDGCAKLMHGLLQNLPCRRIEVDEIWGFIHAKAKTAKALNMNLEEAGDIWTWVAIDADTKLVASFAIGDRSKDMAEFFMDDLASRLKNRVQLTSDGLGVYAAAVEAAFGSRVDYGTVVKTFTHTDLSATVRYSPPEVVKIRKEVVTGSPNRRLISTSFVEKQNHTMRMHCRRLSRLTNAFSKKRENFEAAVSLHFAYYNFVKSHITVKGTPAMAAGITDCPWTVAQLLEKVGE